jgi:hypothetical protein
MLWDGAFVYEKNEKMAYSFAWNNPDLSIDSSNFPSNPNNDILRNVPYPPPCPFMDFAFNETGQPLTTEVSP